MGHLATPEALVMRWNEVLRDPTLQIALGAELMRQLGGVAISECSILTRIGIRVPDVAWLSPSFMDAYGEITPYLKAPEICVEIVSPTNVQAEIDEKCSAYLAAGAAEVWLVSEDGRIRYSGHAGEKTASEFPVSLTLPPPSPKP